jgi:ferredoxin
VPDASAGGAAETTVLDMDPLKRPMRKPIMRGRKWKKDKDGRRPGALDPEDIPNPFLGRGLPYGRRTVYQSVADEQLARGKWWHPMVDRLSEHVDFDLIERGWGNQDLYYVPFAKRPFEDITGPHDIEYHFMVNNLDLHVHMMRSIPHLACLTPELREDFNDVTKGWQTLLREVFPNDSRPGEEYTEETMNHVNYCGEKSVVKYKDSSEIQRRNDLRSELTSLIIKRFVDDCVEKRDFVRILMIDAQGTKHYIYGMVGETLLQAARRYYVPIDGYCNGYDRGYIRVWGAGPWCGVCQMDLDPKYFHLMPPYDFTEQRKFAQFRTITPTSRLGCVIWIRPEFDGMIIHLPVTLQHPAGRWD